jgi:isoleucyl-tRNA synthetase
MRDTVRQVVLPLWNAYYFLTLYAGAAETVGTFRTDQTDVLDRYLLGELAELIDVVTVSMDAYDLFGACDHVQRFLDTLTNWYIRRSRDRFWEGDQDAIDTLHTALVLFTRVTAPLLPMIAEQVHTGLTGKGSVHHQDWPSSDDLPRDDALATGMRRIRDACSTLLSLRKTEGLRVRLPLASATLATPEVDLVRPHIDILRDEVNVKTVDLTDRVADHGSEELVLLPKALGPRLGGDTQKVIAAHKSGDWSVDAGVVNVGDIALVEGEYEFRLVSDSDGAAATLPGRGGIVVLDTEVTPELEREGVARDLIRRIQTARREADLEVSDRISLSLTTSDDVAEAFRAHQEMVERETLVVESALKVADSDEVIHVVATVQR